MENEINVSDMVGVSPKPSVTNKEINVSDKPAIPTKPVKDTVVIPTPFDFKKYTSSDDVFEFEVDGMAFICQEMTVGEELEFFDYYRNSKGKHNIAKLLIVKTTKLVDTPFTIEWIDFIFNKFYPDFQLPKEHEWKDLSLKIRLMFIERLESKFITKIIAKVGDYYNNKEVGVKN